MGDTNTRFEIKQVVCGMRRTLVLTGDIDVASAPTLGGALAHVPMDRDTRLVLDLSRVTFIDSTGIRAIVVAQELCAQRGCEFSLVPGQARVQRVFEICGLLDHLPFRDDEGYVDPGPSEATPATGAAP
jgi:anti-sigma B factor antagonist